MVQRVSVFHEVIPKGTDVLRSKSTY